jgi:hypothetical protein
VLTVFGSYTITYVYDGNPDVPIVEVWFDYSGKYKVWNPYGVIRTSLYSNYLGSFYYPLLVIDRKIWHKSIAFGEG